MMGSPVCRRASHVAAALSIGFGICAAAPARAADDGYANVFSSVLGAVGVIKPDESPEIEYRERPPLVLPPQNALPKPLASGSRRTAAWPQDPDVVRRRKADQEARAPVRVPGDDRNEAGTPGEFRKGRAAAQEESFGPRQCGANGNARGCLVVSPTVLKEEGERYEASNPDAKEVLVPGQVPERVYLTQPPSRYMAATKVVKATTEAPAPRSDEANPRAFLKPHKSTDDE